MAGALHDWRVARLVFLAAEVDARAVRAGKPVMALTASTWTAQQAQRRPPLKRTGRQVLPVTEVTGGTAKLQIGRKRGFVMAQIRRGQHQMRLQQQECRGRGWRQACGPRAAAGTRRARPAGPRWGPPEQHGKLRGQTNETNASNDKMNLEGRMRGGRVRPYALLVVRWGARKGTRPELAPAAAAGGSRLVLGLALLCRQARGVAATSAAAAMETQMQSRLQQSRPRLSAPSCLASPSLPACLLPTAGLPLWIMCQGTAPADSCPPSLTRPPTHPPLWIMSQGKTSRGSGYSI